jgi:peptidoglycan hydrolase-like protein with peptidoglycan-binding domain
VTDGVHYRSIGAWAAADYLTRKMAFLDGRACPVPTSPSAVPDDPCPDPDRTGPITDLEDLYPIGADGVLCYEVGDQRRFECTTDNHVIRIERELVEGMIGDDVQALQTRLVRLDLLDHEALVSAGAVGLFDGLTRSAVVAFQSSASLAATGSADLATLAALGFDTAGIVAGSP